MQVRNMWGMEIAEYALKFTSENICMLALHHAQ